MQKNYFFIVILLCALSIYVTSAESTMGDYFKSHLQMRNQYIRFLNKRTTSCLDKSYYRDQLNDFLDWAGNNFPANAQIPNSLQLFRYMCSQVENTQFDAAFNSNPIDTYYNKWLRYAISYSHWKTELGLSPYQDPPFVWEFLTNTTIYPILGGTNNPVITHFGKTEIIAALSALGVNGPAGYYVSALAVDEVADLETFSDVVGKVLTRVTKSLTSTTISEPGLTLTNGKYWMEITTEHNKNQNSFPKTIITLMEERIPLTLTARWLKSCQFNCINCSGTVCE